MKPEVCQLDRAQHRTLSKDSNPPPTSTSRKSTHSRTTKRNSSKNTKQQGMPWENCHLYSTRSSFWKLSRWHQKNMKLLCRLSTNSQPTSKCTPSNSVHFAVRLHIGSVVLSPEVSSSSVFLREWQQGQLTDRLELGGISLRKLTLLEKTMRLVGWWSKTFSIRGQISTQAQGLPITCTSRRRRINLRTRRSWVKRSLLSEKHHADFDKN